MMMTKLKNAMLNSHFLVGAHVAFLIAIGFMLINSSYEDRLYRKLVSKVVKPNMNQKEIALALLHKTHSLLKPRAKIWGGTGQGIKERYFRSSDILLIEGGACLRFTHVLARALQIAGFDVRIAQMKVGEIRGGHTLLEAKIEGSWVALDSLYDLAYVRQDGKMASFNDISKDWEYFRKQVPSNYNKAYKYEDVRYTNWNKIPVIMPFVKSVLELIMGKDKVRYLSLRSYVLNVYKVYAIMLLVLYIGINGLTVVAIINNRRDGNRTN